MTRHLRASFQSAAILLTLGITAQAQAAFVTGIRPGSKNFQTAGDLLSSTDGTAASRSCWRISHLIHLVTANCKAGSYLPLRQTNFSPSDGTAEGTRLVKDINPGPATLWRTAGTEASTSFLKTIGEEAFSNVIHSLRVYQNKVYFWSRMGEYQENLWVTDGTSWWNRYPDHDITGEVVLAKEFSAAEIAART